MRKVMSVLLLFSVMTFALPQNKSHAIIGGATQFIPLVVAGGVSIGAGVIATAVVWETDCVSDACAYTFLGGLGLAVIGLIILDKKSSDVSFGPLSAEVAYEIGLSRAEYSAFLQERDIVNSIREEIITSMNGRTFSTSSGMATYVANAWKKYQEFLSPEAFRGVRKISEAIAVSLQ